MSAITSSEPLVTVNILSFNRKDDLRVTLTKVFEQDYKNIEVIVVDNASTDGTVEMVNSEFPTVLLIELKENVGIAGWNEGFKAAKGKYILVLDDDSYPVNKTIFGGVSFLLNNAIIGIVAFDVYNIKLKRNETLNFSPNPNMFIGCGALIDIQIIRSVGLFNEEYFIYNHELDYSIRCYNQGFKIYYLSEYKIIHDQSSLSRGKTNANPFASEYRFYHHFLSFSIFLFQNFPLHYSFMRFVKLIINRLIICIYFGYYKSFFRGLYLTIFIFLRYRKNRRIIRRDIQRKYLFGNMPLIDREFFTSYK